jgi:hypothetical protein
MPFARHLIQSDPCQVQGDMSTRSLQGLPLPSTTTQRCIHSKWQYLDPIDTVDRIDQMADKQSELYQTRYLFQSLKRVLLHQQDKLVLRGKRE